MRPQNGQKLRQYQICSQFQSIPEWHSTFEPARHRQTIIYYTVCICKMCRSSVRWLTATRPHVFCLLSKVLSPLKDFATSGADPETGKTQRFWELLVVGDQIFGPHQISVVLEWFGNPLKTKNKNLRLRTYHNTLASFQ